MVTQVNKVLHFDNSRIELSQTGLCFTAFFYTNDSEKPCFHFKFYSDGKSIIEDFKKEARNYMSTSILTDFINKNPDVLRTINFDNLIVN
jgi:hypothetical protein